MGAGIHTIKDLIWTLPLRHQEIPQLTSVKNIQADGLFLGKGRILSSKIFPAFGRRGKGRVQLFNINALLKDHFSEEVITIKWFNTYPNIRKQISELETFIFLGEVKKINDQFSVTNPKINPIVNEKSIIEYSTINGVAGSHTKKLIQKIPLHLWQELDHLSFPIPPQDIKLSAAFMALHGLTSEMNLQAAVERIKYEELAINQLKIKARRLKNQALKAEKYKFSTPQLEAGEKLFPYQFTLDQKKVLHEICDDLNQGYPMMRLIQGDVGCGKTTVALMAAYLFCSSDKQAALMCPTEALAIQHFKTAQKILGHRITIELLTGSLKAKNKQAVQQQLKTGKIDLIIGTHALIQDSIVFQDLALAIIDEQHKFGVNQRLSLYAKGTGVHSIIMTATPIPRSLQLSQFGDLNISTIKQLPTGRKGIQTRIIRTDLMEKYLSFLKTRISLGEQAYIVVPAIEESASLDIENINSIYDLYCEYFPDLNIQTLHGQQKAEDRNLILEDFAHQKINILIATTVIEVGIDNHNSTVLSLYNPERFGLSSIHQLRGRVGRGEKPGFCFLLLDRKISDEAQKRLKVIESSCDGFEIAEEDLKIRGQGDLFGTNQSGIASPFKVANPIIDRDIFERVTQDLKLLESESPEKLNQLLQMELNKIHVSTTI